jgi:regulator of nucleoside diphosphate kinase
METENIVITEADYGRLVRLIESARRLRKHDSEHLDDLEQELERAIVVTAGEVSDDVVTMNSRVRVKDMKSGREATYQIVFPTEADVAENRISVLAPIGTALLGYRAGTAVEWKVPSGMRRFHILEVEYQPEAAGLLAGKEEKYRPAA